ncbi:glutathione S-transferase omega-1 [Octopus sinensis]|uniref:Glutathione S-transferase omega n=1 Tax=Octopus sinensis TaxID=2607531 RepID=A0A7E6FJ37_9MOLL|nr:glutathione S-transferase omega-1 [Octopus sinensis]
MFAQNQACFKSGLQFTAKEALRKLSTYASMVTEQAYTKGSKCPKLEPGTLRLYSMRFCPFAERTRLVLQHKRVRLCIIPRHEIVNINLKHKPDWFLEKTPIGRVPVIEHDSKIIYESIICNEYLEKIFPNPPLTPTDPYSQAKDQMLVSLMDKLLKIFRKVAGRHKGDETDTLINKMVIQLRYFEEELKQRGGPFFGGKQVSMVDFNLWPWFEKIKAKVVTDQTIDQFITKEYPFLCQWNENMLLLPEVKATRLNPQYYAAFIKSFANGDPDYDFGLQLNKSKL